MSPSSVVSLSGERQRRILALLLVNPRRVVTVAEIVAAAWSGEPPATARRQVHTALWQLRRALAEHGGADLLSGQPGGYRLDVEPDRVDLHRFEGLVAEGRRLGAAGRSADAAGKIRAALALWAGPALAGLGGAVLEREAARLEELRLAALEDAVEHELAHTGGPGLIAELVGLTEEHPLRERFASALMVALYRAGRQAEALRLYHRVAHALRGELGVDPGRQLAERHAAILRGDPALGPVPDPDPPEPSTAGPHPAQLPMKVRGFVGRQVELTELDAARGKSQDSAVAVLSAVSGTAGVGKTALAVHWAHRVADAFPDGQLYVDLHGYDPEQPVRPADALAGFLRALGVAPVDIPLEQDDRAALYRSTLAGRRVLVLLDNAGSADQVRPLLPAGPPCFVLVTSRDRLAGLVARDGASRVDLDPLTSDDAVALLRALLGSRVDAEPVAASVLAALCAGLPLAIRVAAELAVARPDVPLSALTDELAGRRRRLDRLDAGGDAHTAVRTVLSWSYQHLPPATQRIFRLIGRHPGPEVDRYAVAALAGTDADEAQRRLAALADGHLLYLTGADRYGMHDLLRGYALELASYDDEPDALNRLFDYYAETATVATDLLLHGRRDAPEGSALPDVALVDSADAVVWLDSERANLVAACGHAARHDQPEHAIQLATTAWRYLDRGGHYADALVMHAHARRAAAGAGDRAAEANALTDLGLVHWRQGDNDRAIRSFQDSLALSEDAADVRGRARALTNLGIAESAVGRYADAAAHLRLALRDFDVLGNPVGLAGTHTNLGIINTRLRRHPEAIEHLEQALRHTRAAGDRIGEAHVRSNLATVLTRQHRYAESAEHLREALHHSRYTGDQVGEAHALSNTGELLACQGRFAEALDHHQRALTHFQASGDQNGEAEALNYLGRTLLAAGRPERAVTEHGSALALASQTADRFEQACAHEALGAAHRDLGDQQRAHHHWRRAVDLFDALGLPHADDIRPLVLTARGDPGERGRLSCGADTGSTRVDGQ